jgi:hypothetical protein
MQGMLGEVEDTNELLGRERETLTYECSVSADIVTGNTMNEVSRGDVSEGCGDNPYDVASC